MSGARTAHAEDGLRSEVHRVLGCRNELGGAPPSAKQEPSVDHVWIAAIASAFVLGVGRGPDEVVSVSVGFVALHMGIPSGE